MSWVIVTTKDLVAADKSTIKMIAVAWFVCMFVGWCIDDESSVEWMRGWDGAEYSFRWRSRQFQKTPQYAWMRVRENI